MSYRFERNDEHSWSDYSRVYFCYKSEDQNNPTSVFVIGYDKQLKKYYITPAGASLQTDLAEQGLQLECLSHEEHKNMMIEFFDNLSLYDPSDFISCDIPDIVPLVKENILFYSSSVFYEDYEYDITMSMYGDDWNDFISNEIMYPVCFDPCEKEDLISYCDTENLDFDVDVVRTYESNTDGQGLGVLFEFNFNNLYN